VTVHRDWDSIGQRGTESGTITLTGVRVEPEFVANVPGRSPLIHAPLRYQAGFAAILVGLGIGALDTARSFVVERSRPWPPAEVEHAGLDPVVRRLAGELTADLAAAYAVTAAAGDQLDAFERGEISRTDLALPIYIAKSVATRAALRATSEVFQLMGPGQPPAATASTAGGATPGPWHCTTPSTGNTWRSATTSSTGGSRRSGSTPDLPDKRKEEEAPVHRHDSAPAPLPAPATRTGLSRRALLRRAALTAGGLAATAGMSELIAACGSSRQLPG
jgi:alkylation response protein AidB-like acyl-CoA dehydrogenase